MISVSSTLQAIRSTLPDDTTIGAFWLLLSHMKWYLALIRAIMREAILAESGRLSGAGEVA